MQSNIKINGQVPTKSQIDLTHSTKDCVFLNLFSDQKYTIETNYDVSEAVMDQGEANTLASLSPEKTPRTRSELIALNPKYDYAIWVTSVMVLPVDGEAVNIIGSFTDDNIVTKTNVKGAVILNRRNCIYAWHQSRGSASTGESVNFGGFKINVKTQNAPNTQYRLHLPKNWFTA